MTLSEYIAEDLQISRELIIDALKKANLVNRHLRIPKKGGGYRTVIQPCSDLKVIHYWLIDNIFSHLPVHEAATAYRKNSSILDNAKRHKEGRYFLKIDLKDFFPSICSDDLIPLIQTWHSEIQPLWAFDGDAISLITEACFDLFRKMPIGYATSSCIANAVMYKFDVEIANNLSHKEQELGNVIYTRYADDMVFSTDKKGCSKEILRIATDLVQKSVSPRLTINRKKIKFSSRAAGSAYVTGIRICSDSHLTLHKKYKDKVRLMLSLYEKGALKSEEFASLKGHLNYVRYSDASFYTKLATKYFSVIDLLLK